LYFHHSQRTVQYSQLLQLERRILLPYNTIVDISDRKLGKMQIQIALPDAFLQAKGVNLHYDITALAVDRDTHEQLRHSRAN